MIEPNRGARACHSLSLQPPLVLLTKKNENTEKKRKGRGQERSLSGEREGVPGVPKRSSA